MKTLLISDIHMSNSLPHAKPLAGGLTDRLNDQAKLWTRVADSARENGVEDTFILGDLFDTNMVDPPTLLVTVKSLEMLPGRKWIMGGNHDASGERFLTDAFGAMGNDTFRFLSPGEHLVGGVRFWALPYSETEKARERLASFRGSIGAERAGREVLLCHHSIVDCVHAGWVCDDGLEAEEVTDVWDETFAGHFHAHQKFGRDERGMYLSAPMHHRFDDEGRAAGWWIVDFRKGKPAKRKFVDGGAPKFHVWEWGSERPENVNPADYLKIRVEATHAEYAALKPEVYLEKENQELNGVKVKLVHKPVYHHTARTKSRGKTASLTFQQAADSYVSAPDVDVTGLDVKRLKRLGAKFLETAQ